MSLRVAQALGHTGPNWRAHNSCPACHYKVEGEPALRFPFEVALDGNNLAKFVDPALRRGRERSDPRNGQSDIWLDEEYVDRFKDEVQNARWCHHHTPAQTVDPDDPRVDCEAEQQDSNEPINVCVDRWRNAAPEACKQMFAVFRKSGIFIAVCCHGFLLSICDMVHSGELCVLFGSHF